MCNAFINYKRYKDDLNDKFVTSLEFRLKVVDGLLEDYERSRGRVAMQGCDLDRLTGRHFPEPIPGKSKPDCIVCSVRPRHRHQTGTRCKQCLKPMCAVKCFERFHTLLHYKVTY